ncbi:phosphatidylinositol N-acetylglucosaminyltransferase subunit C [Melampsora americana]|nr:phosphatidylinositol N-acetylglucosaminyltransferase subunit C [Melampsora americana]
MRVAGEGVLGRNAEGLTADLAASQNDKIQAQPSDLSLDNAHHDDDHTTSDPPPPFRRVLWLKQPYRDNYQSRSLINHLHSNKSLIRSHHQYSTLVLSSLPLSSHLSSITIFIGLFLHLQNHQIDPQLLIWVNLSIGLFGYIVYERAKPARELNRIHTLRSTIILIILILLLSPVLKTLTLSTSSDSIYALTTILISINILLADYPYQITNPNVDVSFVSALSLNAAIFASVLLGSRLDSNAGVFSLTIFALQWFALFPIMRRDMIRKHPNSNLRPIILNISLGFIAVSVIAPISKLALALYTLIVPIGTCLVLPAIYSFVQRYKKDLRGPWDCAIPRIS